MATTANVLGRVLADLQVQQGKLKQNSNLVPSSQLSEIEEKLLEKLQNRLTEIRDSSDWKQVFKRLIHYRCQTEQPLLRGNIDFFLVCLFFHSEKTAAGCDRFFKHLNMCYPCFEEFTEVMRAYTIRLTEWSGKEF